MFDLLLSFPAPALCPPGQSRGTEEAGPASARLRGWGGCLEGQAGGHREPVGGGGALARGGRPVPLVAGAG